MPSPHPEQSKTIACPECAITFSAVPLPKPVGDTVRGPWTIMEVTCPSCQTMVLYLVPMEFEPVESAQVGGGNAGLRRHTKWDERILLWPRGSSRPPCPPEVRDGALRADYTEACLVLDRSPKAAAALARRCLQYILEQVAGVKRGTLQREIGDLLDRHELPSYIADELDEVRKVGNLAAHPKKNEHTGEIVDVEPGEAEMTLGVVEALFDHYFVGPARAEARRAALADKLACAKKPGS